MVKSIKKVFTLFNNKSTLYAFPTIIQENMCVPSINLETAITTLIAGTNPDFNPIFIIDSGCTRPMCKDKHAFTSLVPDKTPVRIADGSIIFTEGIGTIGNFHNIYYVPALEFNLMSVSYLNELKFDVTFKTDSTVIVQDLNGNQQILGTQKQGLFHTTPSFFQTSNQFSLPSPTGSFALYSRNHSQNFLNNLWHQRFNHINDAYINTAIQKHLICGVDIKNISNRAFCDSCAISKSHRVSSKNTPGSRHQAPAAKKNKISTQVSSESNEDDFLLAPLQKFAVDIKGPLPMSIHNFRYALIFTCCATRYRFVYFLKSKDETFNYTKTLISTVRQLGKNIESVQFDQDQFNTGQLDADVNLKNLLSENNILPLFTSIKSDNGTEFVNSDMKELFENYDINHQTSSPYTPHQNGIAERTNRTVFELAAASLYTADVPLRLWPYAVKNVIHSLNHMPNKHLNLSSTPHISVFKTIPDVSYFRTFGCDAFMNLPEHQRPAIGLRSVKGIFLGYDRPRSLSYLVFYKNKVYRTGHVYFNEDMSSRKHSDSELSSGIFELLQQSEQAINDEIAPTAPITDTGTTDDDESLTQAQDNSQQSHSHRSPLHPNFADGPGFNSRSKTKAKETLLYSHLSKVSENDAIEAILSGKYYDPDLEYLLFPEFAYMSAGTISEEDAMGSDQKDLWIQAMHEELAKLKNISTWSTVRGLPENRKALKYKWVLKTKFDIFNKYIHKARLTVKGCAQRQGFDFDETFSPVAQLSAVRLILSHAAAEGMLLYQFDVQNAFPNAELTNIDIYMEPPTIMNLPPNSYLKLHRALYGLRQASREWNLLLTKTLKDLGFKQLVSDSCLFTINYDGEIILLAVYVDDMIICSKSYNNIMWLYHSLSNIFVVNSVILNRCLGLNVTYDIYKRQLTISKDDYTTALVNKYKHYIQNIAWRSTPIDLDSKLSRQQCPTSENDKNIMAKLPFRQIIGALNYLTCTLRADISFATHHLARFMDNPGIQHWNQLLNVVAYLRDHPNANISYNNPTNKLYKIDNTVYHMQRNTLYCFVDSDFASSDLDNRRSTTGYVIYYNGGIISWKSSLQKTTSTSSTEAEYKALHEACKEVVWLTHLLKELGYPHNSPVIVFEDNTSTIRASENPVSMSQLKHIDTKYHQIRDFISEGKVAVCHVESINNVADILTKALSHMQHQYLTQAIINLPQQRSQQFW